MEKYTPASFPEPVLKVSGQFTFVGIYYEFRADCETMYRKNGWADSTTEQYDSIIRNTIYPHLLGHNFKAIGDYTTQDFENAVQAIIAEGKKKGAPDEKKYSESFIQTFRRLIRTVVTVAYQNQKTLYNIYAEDFTEEKKKQLLEYYRLHNIQPKSFSVEQEYAIANYLVKNCLAFGEAVGLLLMFSLGLRCAEATGASFDDLVEIDEYPEFYCLIVLHTTGTNSNIIHVGGKTINANRIIPVPKSLYVMLKQIEAIRKHALQSSGIDVCKSSKLPIVCKGKDYLNRCDTPTLSRAGREMFTQIGMRKEFLIAISMMIDEESAAANEISAEEEFSLVEREPTAYALRRNAATHWHTLLGNDNAVAYLMGHKIYNPSIQQKEYSSIDLLYQINLQLNLRPILNHIHYNDVKYLPNSYADDTTVLSVSNVYDHTILVPPHASVNIIATQHIPGDDISINKISAELDGSMRIQKCKFAQTTPKRRNTNMIGIYHKMYYNLIQDYVISLPESF